MTNIEKPVKSNINHRYRDKHTTDVKCHVRQAANMYENRVIDKHFIQWSLTGSIDTKL